MDDEHLASGSVETRPWTYSIVQGTIVYGSSAPLEELILPTFTNAVAEAAGDPYFCGQHRIYLDICRQSSTRTDCDYS